MSQIRELSEGLINRIAAGEVVERPASVVKELVENSLDAGASQIEIELKEGGKKQILVRDDGVGIAADQLPLAISRHSTSKIEEFDDLYSLNTMGFRGEALASIASVSKFKITSKRKDSDKPARQIVVEAGEVIEESDGAHPVGTSVLVQYLFYQIPARLKFLKSPETEMTHIHDYCTRVALMYPEIGLKVTHNGKKVLALAKANDLQQRLADLFGSDVSEACYPLIPSRSEIQVSGLIGHPQMNKSNNRNMYLFVNKRPVKDKVVFHAVFEGYRNLLMKGRYPFVVLFIDVPHQMVDVNVHPAKTEVRFSQSQVVHRAVYEMVRQTLSEAPWQKYQTPSVEAASPQLQEEQQPYLAAKPAFSNDNQIVSQASRSWESEKRELITQHSNPVPKESEYTNTPFSKLQVLGQVLGTYIVCESEGKIVLVDQHAAHERIGFEKLLKQYQEGSFVSQQLLIPEHFELKPNEAACFNKILDELKDFGFEIDFFGGQTFVLKAYPSILQNRFNIKELVADLVADHLEKNKLTTLKDKLNHVLATMACHAAIRAHDKLNREEMQALVDECDQYQNTSFCPHGRPVSVAVTQYEIEKWFKRIV